MSPCFEGEKERNEVLFLEVKIRLQNIQMWDVYIMKFHMCKALHQRYKMIHLLNIIYFWYIND